MSSAWNDRDDREIRRLWKKAGGTRGLHRRIRDIMKKPALRRSGRKKGAVSRKIDNDLLPALEAFCRVAEREKGFKPHKAIRWLVAEARRIGGRAAGLGESDDAATRRLYQKMKAGNYRKVKIPTADLTFKPADDVV